MALFYDVLVPDMRRIILGHLSLAEHLTIALTSKANLAEYLPLVPEVVRREEMLPKLAGFGNPELLSRLFDLRLSPEGVDACFKLALRQGNVRNVSWFIDQASVQKDFMSPLSSAHVELAALSGSLPLVKMLMTDKVITETLKVREKNPLYFTDTRVLAAIRIDPDDLLQFHPSPRIWTFTALLNAIMSNSTELFLWLDARQLCWPTMDTLCIAATHGNITSFKRQLQLTREMEQGGALRLLSRVAQSGNVQCVRLLCEHPVYAPLELTTVPDSELIAHVLNVIM
jgi:hypothetical protein